MTVTGSSTEASTSTASLERRVALVVHSHATKEELADWAARHSWNCELIPFSWWSPKYRRAVVFTRRIGASWPR